MKPTTPWYKHAIFYELHVRAFNDSSGDGNGDLLGIIQRLDHLKTLGVTCIWLLPIFPSPLRDDGYDVSDYQDIHPDYGNLADFKALIEAAHARGIRIITDLVINHTSDQHPWFQAARQDPDSPFHDYYVWSDTPDKYRAARIIFTDTESSNWAWDEVAQKYYWHRFFSHQPDLNFDNPAVHHEILMLMQFWLDLGIDGFRLDAIPYLYEREGTSCENLPETHTFLKLARGFIDENYPEAILLSEANQWPEDIIPYFGDDDEMHMAFHFPLMPRIFMSLREGTSAAIRGILERTPPIPSAAQWCLFLRNHDELTLEMVTEEKREWMWREYAPDPRMRLNLGIRRRLAPLLDNNLQKLLLAHSIILTMPGSPIFYYGDEIGMGDDISLNDRNGVRTPMQWNAGPNAGFSAAQPHQLCSPIISGPEYGPESVNVQDQLQDSNSLLKQLSKLIEIRQQHPIFSMGDFSWLPAIPAAVLGYQRSGQSESIWVLQNLSTLEQQIALTYPHQSLPLELISGQARGSLDSGKLQLKLDPHQFIWLKLATLAN